jgi:hypothetical protein
MGLRSGSWALASFIMRSWSRDEEGGVRKRGMGQGVQQRACLVSEDNQGGRTCNSSDNLVLRQGTTCLQPQRAAAAARAPYASIPKSKEALWAPPRGAIPAPPILPLLGWLTWLTSILWTPSLTGTLSCSVHLGFQGSGGILKVGICGLGGPSPAPAQGSDSLLADCCAGVREGYRILTRCDAGQAPPAPHLPSPLHTQRHQL